MENRTTVFYVDDNPKSSRLLTSVLEECGFRVITKNDPIEALALCQRTYFDLALLDYEMPLMSGSRLAEEIKFLAPDVPVVLISGALVSAVGGTGVCGCSLRVWDRPGRSPVDDADTGAAEAGEDAGPSRDSTRDDAVGGLDMKRGGRFGAGQWDTLLGDG